MISSDPKLHRGAFTRLSGLIAGVLVLATGLLSAGSAAWNVPPSERFLSIIPPPPAVDSAETKAQIRRILKLQAAADPMRLASARWTYEFSVFTFSLALGPNFKEQRYPQTAVFFHKLNHLVDVVNSGLKDHFKAPHPFQVDPRVRRFVHAIPGYDYPSYHAMRCAVFRRVLSELDPARAAAFRQVAERVEADRVFAGEHFPYSVEAGRKVGGDIFDILKSDARFRADLERLKGAEWSTPPDARDSFSPDD